MSSAVELPSSDLTADISVLEKNGFRLDVIFPADAPRVAELSADGIRLRLDTTSTASASTVLVNGLAEASTLSAGVELREREEVFPPSGFSDEFVHMQGGEWGVGRAGMHYRDLIPKRHGGRVIASHIRISEPGPVPDYVHHHDIRFQMIYCRRGRVEVVYEDQGDSFWMTEGDCVLQPPNIRHRVLASDGGLEVVEIASPAEHPTYIEHEFELPTATIDTERNFGGQRFSFDRADDTEWTNAGSGWQQRATGIEEATGGIASVRVLRGSGESEPLSGTHDGDLCLLFVLTGSATITRSGVTHDLGIDDSIAVPRDEAWSLVAVTDDVTVLHVAITAEEA